MFLVVFKATRALHAADKSLLSVPCICGAECRQVFDQQATMFLPAVLGFRDHAHRLILLLVMDVAHLQVSEFGLPPLRCELGRDDLWPELRAELDHLQRLLVETSSDEDEDVAARRARETALRTAKVKGGKGARGDGGGVRGRALHPKFSSFS